MSAPITVSEVLERLVLRMVADAIAESQPAYWRGRAAALEAARGRRDDFLGRASREVLAARDEALAAAALACRRHADLLAELHGADLVEEVTEILGVVA